MTRYIVDTQEALRSLCEMLQRHEWIAVDTEFMRVRTYFPRLCLIQIGYGRDVVCVDALAGLDLAPLWRLLMDGSLTKVLHAARQDLETMFQLCGQVPLPVFDTQIAAACLGMGDQLGYAALVQRMTGVEISKSHTRTDWARRPLSDNQIRYALDDVRYLGDIYPMLCQRLRERGRLHWVVEECRNFADTGLYDQDPLTAHQRLRNGRILSPGSQQILKTLAKWRECTARKLDKPRAWVVDDAALMAIAKAAPASIHALQGLEQLHASFVRRHGDEVLELVRQTGGQAEPQPVWPQKVSLSMDQKRCLKALVSLCARVAEQEGVAPNLIASRQDLQRIILGDRDAVQLRGWRNELLGAELRRVLAGNPCTAD